MCFLLIVVQETTQLEWVVSPVGIASLVRERFGVELFGIRRASPVPSALMVWLLTVGGSCRRIREDSHFCLYVVAGVLAQPTGRGSPRVTIIPQPSAEPSYISLLVAK